MVAILAAAWAASGTAAGEDKAPFPYVMGKAFHILPETHSEESGYFSLSESLDGRIHVGTAKYGQNCFLVACEDQHWMRYDVATRNYHELGPMLTPYATTLLDARGRANALIADFQLASVRSRAQQSHEAPDPPRWQPVDAGREFLHSHLAGRGGRAHRLPDPDGRPDFLEIGLLDEGAVVKAASRGRSGRSYSISYESRNVMNSQSPGFLLER